MPSADDGALAAVVIVIAALALAWVALQLLEDSDVKEFLSTLCSVLLCAPASGADQSPRVPQAPRHFCNCQVTGVCHCSCSDGLPCDCVDCPCPKSYTALRARALKEGKPLLVWVGCKPAADLGDCLHYRCRSFGDVTCGVVVSAPRGGELAWLETLPAGASAAAVRRALQPPAAAVAARSSAPAFAPAFRPAVRPAAAPAFFRGGGGRSGGRGGCGPGG
jgi:hypothetical protein